MNKSLSEILIEKGLFLTALLSCFIILVALSNMLWVNIY